MCCCWFSTPPERSSGWRAEMRLSVLWEKLAEQVFRWLDIFVNQFLFLLISRKAPKSFMVTSAPHDKQEPSAKKKKKGGAWLSVFPPPNPLVYQASPTSWASPVAQTVKNLPSMKETWVRSLGWEDLLQKGMAIHTSILAWRIPCTEEPGASLITQSVNNLPAVQETRVWFLGREDPWEKEMATYSSILVWRISRGAWQDGVTRVRHDLATKPSPPLHHTHTPPPHHQRYLKSCRLHGSSHFAPK